MNSKPVRLNSSKTIECKRIGIETELYGDFYNLNAKCKSIFNLSYGNPITYEGINIEIDTEYYNYQTEFKARPFTNVEGIQSFKNFIGEVLDKTDGELLSNRVPVGTHFHLFLERGGKPFGGRKDVKMRIVDFIFREVLKFFNANAEAIGKDSIKFEAYRLACGHFIMRYFDIERLGNRHKLNLTSLGLNYINFNGECNRKKYAPVIWSLPTMSGKPMSLELRCIPNTMFISQPVEYWQWFIGEVVKLVNLPPVEDAKKYEDSILHYLFFLSVLVKDFASNDGENVVKLCGEPLKKLFSYVDNLS